MSTSTEDALSPFSCHFAFSSLGVLPFMAFCGRHYISNQLCREYTLLFVNMCIQRTKKKFCESDRNFGLAYENKHSHKFNKRLINEAQCSQYKKTTAT